MEWSKEKLKALYEQPLLDLVFQAAEVHRKHHFSNQIQVCSLISIKTGGCPEDCNYCSQSSRYQTSIKPTPLMKKEEILALAEQAISKGVTRICLGAAWRSVRNSVQFDEVRATVKALNEKGVEVCCTLGMLTKDQAKQLKEDGLYAYNHNLDTSPEYYPSVATTRTYEDRLKTLDAVAEARIKACCGGILGMGETIDDRISLLHVLVMRNPQPESVPINELMPVPGTPFANSQPLPFWDLLRMIATVRIAMPKAMVRLSAGRIQRSHAEQALCFMAGANSIHAGEKLLTCSNPRFDEDMRLFEALNLTIQPAFAND